MASREDTLELLLETLECYFILLDESRAWSKRSPFSKRKALERTERDLRALERDLRALVERAEGAAEVASWEET